MTDNFSEKNLNTTITTINPMVIVCVINSIIIIMSCHYIILEVTKLSNN